MLTLPFIALAEETTLDTVEVRAPKVIDAAPAGTTKSELAIQRSSTSDSARLLQDVPGVSLNGAGGVSSLPAIHGLSDDRIRIQVDGMDLVAACPNHMNSALSYIDPTQVESAVVFAGIAPVSVGGDSIAGTIQMKSAAPEFADEGELISHGQAGAFYRSNGRAYGGNVSASLASENVHFSYSGSSAQSNNYIAGGNFKIAGAGTPGAKWLTGSEVGSTAYTSQNQNFSVALQHAEHQLQLSMGKQHLGFEGFPNQRMDMTANNSTQINVRYTGQYDWGKLEARAFKQDTDHAMNMGPDRFTYGALGMPMLTQAKTIGAMTQGNLVLSEQDILRIGAEYQQYTLNDWWPPAGGLGMGPNTFWNVDLGTRDRLDIFSEWEKYWNPAWMSQIGIRSDLVKANASPVQGYNATAQWANDAANFNALERPHTDHNWDATALTRFIPDTEHTFEAGYARKSHSPNLYQRYPWSTNTMASLMNNFVGDGNGYIGNVNLKPEVAHTLSVTGDWHDAENDQWNLKATSYYTHVEDFIDARRCDFGGCGGAVNLNTTNGFVNLQYINHTARLYGLDLSGQTQLGSNDYGDFRMAGLLNYVRGENKTTSDNLYNIMPLNTKFALIQQVNEWTNSAELQLVDAKTNVSQVRNEMKTAGYSLFNLRSSYEWEHARLDISIENLFNRFYLLPLGGAYVGQGKSMGSTTIPWGVVVPGLGRSINTALNVSF